MNIISKCFKAIPGIFIFIVLVFCCFVHFSFAQVAIIKLKDGNVLRGKVLSKEGGVYKVQTLSLGAVTVSEGDVVSVEEAPTPYVGSKATAPKQAVPSGSDQESSSPVSEEMEGYRKKIMSNPQAMESVSALAEDKAIQEIMNDPELREAIMRQDVDYLKNNEKFLKIASHPALQKIVSDLQNQVNVTLEK